MADDRDEELLEFLQAIRPGEVDTSDEDVTHLTQVTKSEKDSDDQVAPSIPPPSTLTNKNLFVHHDAHPLLLGMVLLERYGPKWLGWEAETLADEIKDDFRQPSISTSNWEKIQAVRTCSIVDSPWVAWEAFVPVTQALNNNVPDFRTLHRPSVAQIMTGLDMMALIKKRPFTEEVSRFIAACFLDDNVCYLPPLADFAQKYAEMRRYHCQKCGRIDTDDDNDYCDNCGAPESQLEKAPLWDSAPVKKRYDHIVDQGKEHDILQENPVDSQVAKLLVARNYVQLRRDQLRHQSRAVINGRLRQRASVR